MTDNMSRINKEPTKEEIMKKDEDFEVMKNKPTWKRKMGKVLTMAGLTLSSLSSMAKDAPTEAVSQDPEDVKKRIELNDTIATTDTIDDDTVDFKEESQKFYKHSEEVNKYEPDPEAELVFESTESGVTIDLSQSFETDKAEISPENHEKISNAFSQFIESVNEGNVDKILVADWVIDCSSDERPTSRDGGNEKLTQDRLAAMADVLQKAQRTFDFHTTNLSPAHVEALLTKKITAHMPEGGVTKLMDMTTPDGESITQDMITGLEESENPEHKKQLARLYAQARYVEFSVDVSSDAEEQIADNNVEEQENNEQQKELFETMRNNIVTTSEAEFFSQLQDGDIFLGDISASMLHGIGKPEVQEALKNIDGDVTFIPFTDKAHLDQAETVKGSKLAQAFEKSKNTSGSSYEFALQASLDAVQELPEDGTDEALKSVYSYCDEGIQNITSRVIKEMQQLEEKKNIQFKIGFTLENGSIMQVTPDFLEALIQHTGDKADGDKGLMFADKNHYGQRPDINVQQLLSEVYTAENDVNLASN